MLRCGANPPSAAILTLNMAAAGMAMVDVPCRGRLEGQPLAGSGGSIVVSQAWPSVAQQERGNRRSDAALRAGGSTPDQVPVSNKALHTRHRSTNNCRRQLIGQTDDVCHQGTAHRRPTEHTDDGANDEIVTS